MIKVEVYLPEEALKGLIEALHEAGFLRVGHYDHVYVTQRVTGHWKSLEGSNPHLGELGKLSEEEECLLSFSAEPMDAGKLRALITRYHPYEEPVIHMIPLI